jgi:hypothetical protein
MSTQETQSPDTAPARDCDGIYPELGTACIGVETHVGYHKDALGNRWLDTGELPPTFAGSMRSIRKSVNRRLDRVTPWRRGYSEGFDDGIRIAIQDIEHLLGYEPVPRGEVMRVLSVLQREIGR